MNFDRKDKKYWKLGIFYFNPEDKNTLVPKRFGIGATINFGRPVGMFIGLAVLAAIIISIVLRGTHR